MRCSKCDILQAKIDRLEIYLAEAKRERDGWRDSKDYWYQQFADELRKNLQPCIGRDTVGGTAIKEGTPQA